MTGGVRKLTGAQLAEHDQLEAGFDEIEFRPGVVEVRLTKGNAAKWSGPKMTAFLSCLARWSQRMSDDGYVIVAAPDEGPGTMVWKAVKR